MTYPQNFEEKIGFNDIRKLLQEKCLSTLGEEKVTQLQFHKEHALLNELHAHTKEFLSIMNEEEDFPDQYFFDVREAIKRIRIEGTYLFFRNHRGHCPFPEPRFRCRTYNGNRTHGDYV